MRRSNAKAPLLLAWACLGISGCEVGPNFTAPLASAATGYVIPAAPAPGTLAAAVPTPQRFVAGERLSPQWWTLFHSAALDAVVKEAVSGSLSLEVARARVAQAQEAVGAARSAWSPQVSLSASAARERLTAASFGLPASALALPANFNLLQVGPLVSYPLDLFGATRRRIERAQALAQVQDEGLAAGYLALTGNTVLQLIELAMLRGQRQALQDTIDLDRRNLELLRAASRLGGIAASEVVLAQTQLAQDEALGAPLDQSLSTAAHALAVLLGHAPGEWRPPPLTIDDLTLPAQIPVSLSSQLVQRRPDIAAAAAQLRAASAQIGIATAALYPDINLTAFINGSSLNGSNLFDPANVAWSIAAGLTQPIFDGRLRRAERREALAAYRGAAADYQQTVLAAFRQVADLLEALNHDAELLAAQKGALDSAAQAVELQRAAFTRGSSGVLGLLDAQRQYHQSVIQYVRAQAQRYEDTAQLLVAMGGGWEQGDATALPH